jgi:hypothetical protein
MEKQLVIDEVWYKEFCANETKLMNEIIDGKLKYKEAQECCDELFHAIPAEYFINPINLNYLMQEIYKNDPDYHYDRKFKITVKDFNKAIKKNLITKIGS